MIFNPDLSAIRFGCGLSPVVSPAASVGDILSQLAGEDRMAQMLPIEGFDAAFRQSGKARKLNRARRKATSDAERADAEQQYRDFTRARRRDHYAQMARMITRQVQTSDGFRERLVLFWGDHFTAQGKNAIMRPLSASYLETMIRPHVTGQFGDLLVAAVTSPLMLHYLDQQQSVGPQSRHAKSRDKARGLNENLAREVLELHTLGVDGPYTQRDVRELAALFTGMRYQLGQGVRFDPARAEPGGETVLGQIYGGAGKAEFADIHRALWDLATHPATARHVAWKLAVHFTGDQPDAQLVDHMAARFLATDGDLLAVYGALLDHPAAWRPQLNNVKPPFDFIASACRALNWQPKSGEAAHKQTLRQFYRPLRAMGQRWHRPNGPDGWSEWDQDWITPQGLAARLAWAMAAPRSLRADLPPPAQFVSDALGSYADGRVRFAAGAAETRAEAIGLVLSAPAFQRR